MNKPIELTMPDVQSARDERLLAIDRVGIKSIRHPIRIVDKSGAQNSVGVFAMDVYLPHDLKGTHMSRFVEMLNVRECEISVASFDAMLREMVGRLEAPRGRIEVRFPFFLSKAAPISGVRSLLDYEVTLIGEIDQGRTDVTVQVSVPVTSACPCSKEISDYGAHNQRSHITVTASLRAGAYIEDLIRLCEQQASAELYGLLKRPDEKFVTERAYDNPKFVEDIVRDVALALNRDERVLRYAVETENFESIHNHSAYARIEHDKRNA